MQRKQVFWVNTFKFLLLTGFVSVGIILIALVSERSLGKDSHTFQGNLKRVLIMPETGLLSKYKLVESGEKQLAKLSPNARQFGFQDGHYIFAADTEGRYIQQYISLYSVESIGAVFALASIEWQERLNANFAEAKLDTLGEFNKLFIVDNSVPGEGIKYVLIFIRKDTYVSLVAGGSQIDISWLQAVAENIYSRI